MDSFRERLRAFRERIDRENGLLCLAGIFVLLSLACFVWTGQSGEGDGMSVLRTRPALSNHETETQEEAETPEAPGILPGERLDLNSSSEADLTRLPGIGASRAAEIVAWREANGGFETTEQIQEVYGIGPKTYERIEAYITTSDVQSRPQAEPADSNESKSKDGDPTDGPGQQAKSRTKQAPTSRRRSTS